MSVLAQTYQNFEILVVDDGSTDDTQEIVKHYPDERITYHRHEKNKGGSAARNTGIREAKGDLIAFLDSDDEWLPQKLEKQVAMSVTTGQPDATTIVYTGLFYVDEESKEVLRARIPAISGWLFPHLIRDNIVGSCSTVMVPRTCLDMAGTFDETLQSSQDLDLWLRLARTYPFRAIEEPLVRVYVHEARITEDVRAKVHARRRILEKFWVEITRNKRAHAYYHFKTGNIYCHHGFLQEGRGELLKAIKIDPFTPKYYGYLLTTYFGFPVFQKLAGLKGKFSVFKA